jgi:AraC-like DNA-binding protein
MTHLRVERAKKLLLNSNLDCKEICYLVGFSSQVVGAHVFKRLTGITMKEHMKGNRPGTRTIADDGHMSAHWKLK